MRSKKAMSNIFFSFLSQITSIVIGLILPKLLIQSYGSDVNGLMSSITQFLGYIVLLEAGVGGIVRAALYKPLAQKDVFEISQILKSSERFFRIIAFIFILYLFILAIIFPEFINSEFDFWYTSSLILIMGVSTFFQYYFGITYQILLQADQKQYIIMLIQIITIVLNAIGTVFLINYGASIHVVKFASSIIFLIRPIIISLYIKYKYIIIRDCPINKDAIEQKWDGLAHHIAFLIHTNTDIAILTFFSTFKEVSVYSVYYMIVTSIRKITTTFSSGLEATFGNIIANDEKLKLNKSFEIFEILMFMTTTICFTSCVVLIIPFVELYTSNIHDINYIRPLFAYILILSEVIYCVRLPYTSVVLAAGHYRETKNGAYIEAFINIVVSILAVKWLGITGVAIGTLCAMMFRTVQYVFYLSNNILEKNIYDFIKKIFMFFSFSILIIFFIKIIIPYSIHNYKDWIIYAIKVTSITMFCTILFSYSFYRNQMTIIKNIIKIKIFNMKKLLFSNRMGEI